MTIVDLSLPRVRRRRDDRFAGDLELLASVAGQELEDASAPEIVRWAAATFGERVAVTSSMADAVVAHLVSRVKPGVDVLFLNTGYHFAETIGTRDAVAAMYDVNVLDVTPAISVAQQDAAFGKDLWARDPDRCCALRKVSPLNNAMRDYDAWITGLRRDETPARATTPVVSWDAGRAKVKICPIARWTAADVDAYVGEHHVLLNPLLMDGYDSIGCRPCTRRVEAGEDARAGRWAGSSKTECGLHS
ncbi:MAG: phosphoadenosine phosphosulfate reductase [Nocardioidaceae bacterium]|jgi:phosphoadenosine phosphosulfate reductase|nr:phosphoadenosine phosphosulfate reductase [Nocardioidaceae bacterium]